MTLPLKNWRILVTRSRGQASELAALLEAMGASTILIPTIEIAPPSSYGALDDAIARLDRFDWLVFTSANAVEAFRQRFALHGSHTLDHIQTAAIGPATARAATQIGLKVAIMPEKAVAECLSAALMPHITQKSSILLPRAAAARDHLPDTLKKTTVDVTVVDAYQTLVPKGSIAALQKIFLDIDQYPDAITFTSSSAVTNLFHLLEDAGLSLPLSIARASIGPITSQTLTGHGFPAHVEAAKATISSLAEALVMSKQKLKGVK